MGTKPRIKDIAKLAGVSAGTVDRVLHGRGRVSEESRAAVERALQEVGYMPNLHLSAISMKKKFRLAVVIPQYERGEYWEQLKSGILRALKEYNAIDIRCEFICYNQFDLFSCRETFAKVATIQWDAVIIGPTFIDETIALTDILDEKRIPYAFVDSMVEGSSPVGFFSANQQVCGYLLAKLLHQMSPEDSEYVLFSARRVGDESANNTVIRRRGFMQFFEEKGLSDRIKTIYFSPSIPEENETLIGDFFARNPDIHSGAVLSSRGGMMADWLHSHGLDNIKLVTFDLTEANRRELEKGSLGYVICQRPALQGFSAVKAVMMKLVFGHEAPMENYMPLDIITQENLDYYSDMAD